MTYSDRTKPQTKKKINPLTQNEQQAIDYAANYVGGIRELGRKTDWNVGSIAAVKNGTKPMPPWRAAALAQITKECKLETYFFYAEKAAKSKKEKKILIELGTCGIKKS